MLPLAQQIWPEGHSEPLLQGMREPVEQVSVGPKHVRTVAPVEFGSVAQQPPPPLETGQLSPRQATLAAVQVVPLTHFLPAGHPPVLRSVQVVAQLVGLEQSRFPGHGAAAVAGMQVPLPLHWPAGVSIPALHDGFPHGVPRIWRRQAPSPSHVPSRPH